MNDLWGNALLNSYSAHNPKDLRGTKVVIFVWSLKISGGSNLILSYAQSLQSAGASVTIAFAHGVRTDASWHPAYATLDYRYIDQIGNEPYDLGIATFWRTVELALRANCVRYVYFVQSLEGRFARNYADSVDEIAATVTYCLGLQTISIASWLQGYLTASLSAPCFFVPNGVDKEIFKKPVDINRPSEAGKLRVLVEGPLNVPMKTVNESLQLLFDQGKAEVWHVSPESGGSHPKADMRFERVPFREMPKIYSQVDVILKMSRVEGMFGPPLEAFHCGATAVVSRVTGFDEYIRDFKNSISVNVDDYQAAIYAIGQLDFDRDLLGELKEGALLTAANWPSIEHTGKLFVNYCWQTLTSQNLGKVNKTWALEQIHEAAISKSVPAALYSEFKTFFTQQLSQG